MLRIWQRLACRSRDWKKLSFGRHLALAFVVVVCSTSLMTSRNGTLQMAKQELPILADGGEHRA